MQKYIWLSYPLDVNGPLPPGIPAGELKPLYTLDKDGSNVQILKVANHSGTHVDSPLHMLSVGACITDFAPDELIFNKPAVVDLKLEDAEIILPEHIEPYADKLIDADIILFRSNRGTIRREEPERFGGRSPGFSVDAAKWLLVNCPNMRAIGMDLPSVVCIPRLEETERVHHILLGSGDGRFLIIEEMNLEHDLQGLKEVRLCPWLVVDMDSGPCSVVGIVETDE